MVCDPNSCPSLVLNKFSTGWNKTDGVGSWVEQHKTLKKINLFIDSIVHTNKVATLNEFKKKITASILLDFGVYVGL